MVRPLSSRQDLLSNLVSAHNIQVGHDTGKEKIAIERLELRLDQPAGVSLTLGRVHALSAVRRRRPPYLLPPRPPAMINRSQELETLSQTVLDCNVADLYGPDGAGKSALAAALAHTLDRNHFPDGILFVKGQIRYQDLLQALFDSFYESDTPVKITSPQAHTYLHNLKTLVILDDTGLGPKQIDPILDALDEAAVLIVGQERAAPGRGQAFSLKGLPRQQAVTLFEQAWGRTPSTDEYPVIEQLCALLNDMPLTISCMAMQAARSKQSLTKFLTDLQGRKSWAGPGGDRSVGPSLEQIVLALDATDRQLLTLIAAFAGPDASSEALRKLLNLSAADFHKRVQHLQGLGLLDAVGPQSRRKPSSRQALAPAYHHAVRTWLVEDVTRREIVNHYTSRLGQGEQLPGDELPNLLGAIEDCARNGWLEALEPLVRAADRSLAWLGWWAEWQHVLDLTRRAAQAGGDRALEAWAMHQLGAVLGALGAFERAHRMLRTALSMRQALDDEAGATVSARNLQVLDHLMPAPVEEPAPAQPSPAPVRAEPAPVRAEPAPAPQAESDEPPPSSDAKGARSKLRWALLALSALLVIGTLGIQFILRGDGTGDEEPGLTVYWEFGDAWNSYDNTTWTQQIIIKVEGGDGDYRYFADGEPVAEMFEVTLPFCEGAQGTIEVQWGDNQTTQIEYEFDSPFCP